MPTKLGHVVRHLTARSGVHLTPIMSIPMIDHSNSPTSICPSCHVWHPVKTLHIWVDDTGKAMISQGVLDLLNLATPPMDDFALEGSTTDPPPLKAGAGIGRPEVDYENRAQTYLTEVV